MKTGRIGWTAINVFASLPEESRSAFALAIFEYLADGVEPPQDVIPAILWRAIALELDRRSDPEEISKKRADAGRKGAERRWGKMANDDKMAKMAEINNEVNEDPKTEVDPEDPKKTGKDPEVRRTEVDPEDPKEAPNARARGRPRRTQPGTQPDGDAPTAAASDFGLRSSGFAPQPSSASARPEQFDDPVDYALAVTGEPNTKQARNCYGGLLRDLGPGPFCDIVERFAAEVRAGERVRSPGAALNTRLSVERFRRNNPLPTT